MQMKPTTASVPPRRDTRSPIHRKPGTTYPSTCFLSVHDWGVLHFTKNMSARFQRVCIVYSPATISTKRVSQLIQKSRWLSYRNRRLTPGSHLTSTVSHCATYFQDLSFAATPNRQWYRRRYPRQPPRPQILPHFFLLPSDLTQLAVLN